MTFTSLPFLSLFLPFSLLFVHIAGRRWGNLALLLASILFCALNDLLGVPVLIVSILWNYSLGSLLSRDGNRWRALSLSVGVGGNLLLLGFFKYAAFFMESLSRLLPFLPQGPVLAGIHQPLGISFFTFQSIAYLIDLYRNVISFDRNFCRFGLYLAIFPHLVAGPIIRFGDIYGQLLNRHVTVEVFASGLRRFVQGLGKKMLLANMFAGVADRIFALPSEQLSQGTAWLGAFLYSLQIYYDFSGYTDMAIGIGRLFGFEFPENFNYPYAAASVRDFWRRWHMTLSSWFRDYLYVPLGGSRGSEILTYLNLVLVFTLCGLWHGASWSFLAWGGVHGLCMVAERLGLERLLRRGSLMLQHGYVLLVLMSSWVIFRAANISEGWSYLRCMFWSSRESMVSPYPPVYFMTTELSVVIAIGVAMAFPWWRSLLKGGAGLRWMGNGHLARAFILSGDALLLIILVAGLMEIAAGGYHPFIYLQF